MRGISLRSVRVVGAVDVVTKTGWGVWAGDSDAYRQKFGETADPLKDEASTAKVNILGEDQNLFHVTTGIRNSFEMSAEVRSRVELDTLVERSHSATTGQNLTWERDQQLKHFQSRGTEELTIFSSNEFKSVDDIAEFRERLAQAVEDATRVGMQAATDAAEALVPQAGRSLVRRVSEQDESDCEDPHAALDLEKAAVAKRVTAFLAKLPVIMSSLNSAASRSAHLQSKQVTEYIDLARDLKSVTKKAKLAPQQLKIIAMEAELVVLRQYVSSLLKANVQEEQLNKFKRHTSGDLLDVTRKIYLVNEKQDFETLRAALPIDGFACSNAVLILQCLENSEDLKSKPGLKFTSADMLQCLPSSRWTIEQRAAAQSIALQIVVNHTLDRVGKGGSAEYKLKQHPFTVLADWLSADSWTTVVSQYQLRKTVLMVCSLLAGILFDGQSTFDSVLLDYENNKESCPLCQEISKSVCGLTLVQATINKNVALKKDLSRDEVCKCCQDALCRIAANVRTNFAEHRDSKDKPTPILGSIGVATAQTAAVQSFASDLTAAMLNFANIRLDEASKDHIPKIETEAKKALGNLDQLFLHGAVPRVESAVKCLLAGDEKAAGEFRSDLREFLSCINMTTAAESNQAYLSTSPVVPALQQVDFFTNMSEFFQVFSELVDAGTPTLKITTNVNLKNHVQDILAGDLASEAAKQLSSAMVKWNVAHNVVNGSKSKTFENILFAELRGSLSAFKTGVVDVAEEQYTNIKAAFNAKLVGGQQVIFSQLRQWVEDGEKYSRPCTPEMRTLANTGIQADAEYNLAQSVAKVLHPGDVNQLEVKLKIETGKQALVETIVFFYAQIKGFEKHMQEQAFDAGESSLITGAMWPVYDKLKSANKDVIIVENLGQSLGALASPDTQTLSEVFKIVSCEVVRYINELIEKAVMEMNKVVPVSWQADLATRDPDTLTSTYLNNMDVRAVDTKILAVHEIYKQERTFINDIGRSRFACDTGNPKFAELFQANESAIKNLTQFSASVQAANLILNQFSAKDVSAEERNTSGVQYPS